MVTPIEDRIKSLEQILEKEGTKCVIKMQIETGAKDDSDEKKCSICDGYSSVILCEKYMSINHLIDYYKRFL